MNRTALLFLCSCLSGFSATVNVSSFGDGTPSQANAQAAYNTCSEGDVLAFPGGSATWSTGLTITNAITIFGSNTTLTLGASLIHGFFYITTVTSTVPFRISGFTLNMVNFDGSRAGIYFDDSKVDLSNCRVDHNVFHFGYVQVSLSGTKGVMDHNVFYNGRTDTGYTAGSNIQASNSWNDLTMGTSNAMFIENNQFIDDANMGSLSPQERIGSDNGGKVVVRYNEFNFDNTAYTGNTYPILFHGSASGGTTNGYWQTGGGARRGQSTIECYMNNMHGKRIDWMAIMRGSACMIWSNTLVTAGPTPNIQLREEEYTVGGNWTPVRTNWPAEDQVHNTFVWSNSFNGVLQTSNKIVITDTNIAIVMNQDWFPHEPQASGGSESFTGAPGASGSYPTDGVKFKTLGTMVFTSSGANAYYPYTPFTFPHPSTLNTNNPTLFVTPTSLNFGTTSVARAVSLTLGVTNIGGGTLTGTATANSPFVVTSGGSYSLGDGIGETVTIQLTPSVPGDFSGVVTLTGGDGAIIPVTGSVTNLITTIISGNVTISGATLIK